MSDTLLLNILPLRVFAHRVIFINLHMVDMSDRFLRCIFLFKWCDAHIVRILTQQGVRLRDGIVWQNECCAIVERFGPGVLQCV